MMKRLWIAITNFFHSIWYRKRNKEFTSINEKLNNSLKERTAARIKFIKEFHKELRKYLKRDASGKYIPIKGKNKAEIHAHVIAKHGDRLKELDLVFTKNLELK